MKSLRSFITENYNHFILESFSSKELTKIFKDTPTYLMSKEMGRLLAFDKIKDEDLDVISIEIALKLAYRKDSTDFIIWVNKGKTKGRKKYPVVYFSIGNVVEMGKLDDLEDYKDNISLKKLAQECEYAVLVRDWRRYSTKELRRQREEQKQNALALRSAWSIACENKDRYEEFLQENRDFVKLRMDIYALFNEAKSEYDEIMTKILSDGMINIISSDNVLTNKLNYLNEFFNDVVKEMMYMMDNNRKPMVDKIQDFKDLIKRFKEYMHDMGI